MYILAVNEKDWEIYVRGNGVAIGDRIATGELPIQPRGPVAGLIKRTDLERLIAEGKLPPLVESNEG